MRMFTSTIEELLKQYTKIKKNFVKNHGEKALGNATAKPK